MATTATKAVVPLHARRSPLKAAAKKKRDENRWQASVTRLLALGKQCRVVREALCVSQEALAKAAGVSQGAVSRFEGGRGKSTPYAGVAAIVGSLAEIAHTLPEAADHLPAAAHAICGIAKHVFGWDDTQYAPGAPCVDAGFARLSALYVHANETKRESLVVAMETLVRVLE